MFPAGAPVLVMVSGGGDSVALLRLFSACEFGELRLRVLHVNHLLRGAESDADEAFVRELCASVGVECRVVRYDVAAHAAEFGLNLEDAGRQIRYRFAAEELDALCAELGEPPGRGRIATAHTRDDRIETFFMRAIAGSGSGGLASIAAVRDRIVRPLIGCDRAQVREWLESAGATWREDASNADVERSRALVRAEIVPAAQRLNPGFRSSLERTMDLLGDDDALLTSMSSAFARDFAEVRPDVDVAFEREWMRTLERTMARRTVRSALHQAFPDASRIEAAHVEALVDGLADDSFARDLPGGLRARTEYGKMIVSRTTASNPRVAPCLLPLPGTADLGESGRIVAENTGSNDTTGDAHSVVIDAGGIGGELTVDSPREGDRMRPLGMDGSRKLSDLLIDAKVARAKRPATPVVRDGERIVWLASVRMSDEYRVTGNTTRAVRLTWIKADDVAD